MYKHQNFFFIGLFALLGSILISDLLFISYSSYFSFLTLIYVIGYLVIVFNNFYLNFKSILYIFVILKSYIFVVALFDFSMADRYMHFLHGDAYTYHIPAALKIGSLNDAVAHLFSLTFNFNGRLTHVFLSFAYHVMPSYSNDIFYNIALNGYLLNFLFNIFTLIIVYKTIIFYFSNISLARKIVIFIAFNPFFLYYSSMPQKEALLFFALSMLVYFLVTNRYKYLFLSSMIFLFERIYMLLLTTLLIFFLSKINRYYKIIILVIGFVVVERFLGIERALSMHAAYIANMKATTKSFLPFDNIIGDILRIFFSPFILRPFLTSGIGDNIFYSAYYLTLPLYIYFMIKSLFSYKYYNKIILMSHLQITRKATNFVVNVVKKVEI